MVEPENNKGEVSLAEGKSKKTSKKKAKNKLASSKTIETMYRNAYRANLDMISLAAVKANIMISLNGVIMSILLVTGRFIYTSAPVFLLPTRLFLISAVISMFFAISAASPATLPSHTRFFSFIWKFFKGEVGLKDFKKYINVLDEEYDKDRSNILIFMDSARLSKEEYLNKMSVLVNKPEKAAEKMNDQLYWLGKVAEKKFLNLHKSYLVFRWGVILSIFLFLILEAKQILSNDYDHEPVSTSGSEKWREFSFTNIYEASGIQQLSDGRLIVIEDESKRALHILEPRKNGKLIENKSLSSKLREAFKTELNDLEAVTLGPDGLVYASTSHKRKKSGLRDKSREQLIRFRIEGDDVLEISIVNDLHDAINASGILKNASKHGKDGLDHLNIEAISFDKQNRLMIGLRKPQIDGQSIILLLENPFDIFNPDIKPVISKTPILLDLQGGGFRAMTFDSIMGKYLITNETSFSTHKAKHSQILSWDGDPEHQPELIHLSSNKQINNIEGVSSLNIDGAPQIILVSDNGYAQKNRAAEYYVLGYNQLAQ